MEYTNEKRENKQDNRKNDDITLVQKISLKKTNFAFLVIHTHNKLFVGFGSLHMAQ